ncbi:MAG: hypothetical protein ACYSTY_09250, partial [Planctomycetota bacterium]
MQEQGTTRVKFAINAAGCALIAVLAVAGPVVGQGMEKEGIQVFGVRDARPLPDPKPPVLAPSQRLGLELGAVPAVTLGPVDVAALLAEDQIEAELGSKAMRVSVARDVLVRLRDGQWHDVPGGSLWVADIAARDAIGLRLHFTGMNLPDGAEVVVYGFEPGLGLRGPYASQGALGDGSLWTGTVLGERARIEYFVPAGAAGGNPDVPFAVDSIQHIYVDFFRRGEGGGGAGGACHNDPTCFPAWDDVADSVGLVQFTDDGGGGFICSGQLLSTVIADQTPYYLTAAHCINSSSEAASAEIFWRFETMTCNGAPFLGPTSSFCSLADTYGSADESLLLVEGTLPTGMFWSGWQTSQPAQGTASACIHHPLGDYKRISFGSKINTPNCGGSSTNFVRASWTDGVTEGGSSGSGLWRDSNKLLYATLTCGASSCSNPNGDDSFGRFDRAYTAGGFSVSLAAGSDDGFEDNDTCAAPGPMPFGVFANQVVKSTDEDWYVVALPSVTTLDVDLTFTHAFGDIDMELFDACGGSLVSSASSNTNNESLTYTNLGATGNFYLRIFLDTDTRNTYTLITSIDLVNDDCANAVIVGAGVHGISNVGATTDGPNEPASCNFDGDSQVQSDVWYRFFAQCTGTATVSLCGSGYDTKIAVY